VKDCSVYGSKRLSKAVGVRAYREKNKTALLVAEMVVDW